MSIDSFITASNNALPVFHDMIDFGMSDVLTLTGSSRLIMYWNDIKLCIKRLHDEASCLKDFQDIVHFFVGLEDPWSVSGGLFRVGERFAKYSSKAYLDNIESELYKWKCVGDSQLRASQLRCPNDYVLYNLANEFQGFERAAVALNSAQSAGSTLLEGIEDPILEKKVKKGLHDVVDFYNREFTEIVECEGVGRKNEFALLKRRLYASLIMLQPKDLYSECEMGSSISMSDQCKGYQNAHNQECLGEELLEFSKIYVDWLYSVSDRFQQKNQDIHDLAVKLMNKVNEELQNNGKMINILYASYNKKLPNCIAAPAENLKDSLSQMNSIFL